MKLIKKDNLYFPSKEFQKRAWVKNKSVYQKAAKDPILFWENAAKELLWSKKWKKTFINKNKGSFQWFVEGKTNITSNIFERTPEYFSKIRNKVALIFEPESPEEKPVHLTYYDLYRKVNQLANALKKLGVKKGDRVGIYLPMIPEVIISMLACARIGAVHIVVFSAFAPEALKKRLEVSGAKILITADGYWRRGKIIELKKSADQGIKGTKVQKVIVVKRMGNKIEWQKNKDLWFEELIKNESDYCQAREMDSEDPLFILPESGTGGEFLPILHTTGGYMVQAYLTAKWIFDLHQDDLMWSTADVGWVTGHTYSCYGPLLNRATILLFEGAIDWPKPDRWAEIIEKYGVTIFYTAPTAIRMFAKAVGKKIKKYQFKTLKILGSVGEPIDEKAWNWFFQEVGKERCPLLDTYWQTETGGIVISSLPGVGPFKPTFTGLPFPGIKVDILDEKGKSCKKNEEGNLVILPPFSPGLLRGVYGSSQKYFENYWSQYSDKYFTSDLAYRDDQGLIRIVGRADDVIKVAGHRISTAELENIISKVSEINEVAVIGVPDKIKGEIPVVFAVLKSKPNNDIEQKIIQKVEEGFGKIARPGKIYFVQELPKTRSGKIMRRLIKNIFTAKPLGDISSLANPESIKEVKQIINNNS